MEAMVPHGWMAAKASRWRTACSRGLCPLPARPSPFPFLSPSLRRARTVFSLLGVLSRRSNRASAGAGAIFISKADHVVITATHFFKNRVEMGVGLLMIAFLPPPTIRIRCIMATFTRRTLPPTRIAHDPPQRPSTSRTPPSSNCRSFSSSKTQWMSRRGQASPSPSTTKRRREAPNAFESSTASLIITRSASPCAGCCRLGAARLLTCATCDVAHARMMMGGTGEPRKGRVCRGAIRHRRTN